jgi:cyclohexa-1,5-dienecarbonyl-CoA hydratase
MTSYQHIRFEVEDRVARITLERLPLNVFNISMMQEITLALEECVAPLELVAIVFEAAPGAHAFSAGVAVEEHVAETIFQMLESFHAIFRSLEQLAKPTIAVVDGAALGGGCELVAACDIVIASDRARFGQPEIKLGVFPPVACVLLPLVIGDKRAREMIFTGDMIGAAEAARLGLVNHLVPSLQLQQKTQEILTKLREYSGASLEATRRALDLGRARSLADTLAEIENMYLHELMKTDDAKEGIRAFMEKRKPLWRGR